MLGAISAGAARPSEIAATLGRPEGAVDDAVGALIALGLIERLQDPLNGDRSVCVIVKPIARLHQLVIAPYEPELAAGQADRVWSRARATVDARIYRPHFASVARQWCLRHAAEATLGGAARGARPTVIACREHHREHELAAVVVADPVATGRVIAIGETNAASGPMDAGQLRRLEHLRALLPGDRVGRPPRLLLFEPVGLHGRPHQRSRRPRGRRTGRPRAYLPGRVTAVSSRSATPSTGPPGPEHAGVGGGARGARYVRGGGRAGAELGKCPDYADWLHARTGAHWEETAAREPLGSGMFERFTDRARRVVVQAQDRPGRSGTTTSGTEHLLLGLISEGGGLGAKALESLGVSAAGLRAGVAEIVGRGQQSPSSAHTVHAAGQAGAAAGAGRGAAPGPQLHRHRAPAARPDPGARRRGRPGARGRGG